MKIGKMGMSMDLQLYTLFDIWRGTSTRRKNLGTYIPTYLNICIAAYLLAYVPMYLQTIPAYLHTCIRTFVHTLCHYAPFVPKAESLLNYPRLTERPSHPSAQIILQAVPNGGARGPSDESVGL